MAIEIKHGQVWRENDPRFERFVCVVDNYPAGYRDIAGARVRVRTCNYFGTALATRASEIVASAFRRDLKPRRTPDKPLEALRAAFAPWPVEASLAKGIYRVRIDFGFVSINTVTREWAWGHLTYWRRPDGRGFHGRGWAQRLAADVRKRIAEGGP